MWYVFIFGFGLLFIRLSISRFLNLSFYGHFSTRCFCVSLIFSLQSLHCLVLCSLGVFFSVESIRFLVFKIAAHYFPPRRFTTSHLCVFPIFPQCFTFVLVYASTVSLYRKNSCLVFLIRVWGYFWICYGFPLPYHITP